MTELPSQPNLYIVHYKANQYQYAVLSFDPIQQKWFDYDNNEVDSKLLSHWTYMPAFAGWYKIDD